MRRDKSTVFGPFPRSAELGTLTAGIGRCPMVGRWRKFGFFADPCQWLRFLAFRDWPQQIVGTWGPSDYVRSLSACSSAAISDVALLTGDIIVNSDGHLHNPAVIDSPISGRGPADAQDKLICKLECATSECGRQVIWQTDVICVCTTATVGEISSLCTSILSHTHTHNFVTRPERG